MTRDYDVIVLGGGSPGEHCAGALAEGGLRVAIVERELVGGECSYWACIPSKTLLRPGEARRRRARDAGAARPRQVDVAGGAGLARLAWSPTTTTPARSAGWRTRASTSCAATAGSPGRDAVEVDGVPYAAEHVVVATGADPFIPPVPGLRELDGVWTNREVTGMTGVPAGCSCSAAGRSASRWRRRVRRLGGEVALVGRAAACCRASPRRSARRSARRCAARASSCARRARDAARAGTATTTCSSSRTARELRGDRLLVATGRRPRVDGIGLETVGIEPTRGRHPGRRAAARRRRVWAIGDVTGIWLFTHVGKYQGDVVAANILGEPREANYDAVPRVVFTDPQAAAVGATEARFSATAPLSEHPASCRPTRARTPSPTAS